jgi:hypothetical protein
LADFFPLFLLDKEFFGEGNRVGKHESLPKTWTSAQVGQAALSEQREPDGICKLFWMTFSFSK